MNAVDENYRLHASAKNINKVEQEQCEIVTPLNISEATAKQAVALSTTAGKPTLVDPQVVSKYATKSGNDLVAANAQSFKVVDVKVAVPENLIVSEANLYLPQADIVWREDPLGDRKAQVSKIIETALRAGTAQIQGEREVIMSVRLKMFHALTEKARNSVGGKHNVQFDYVLLDANTGQPVSEVKSVNASLNAYGGRRAYEAMHRGETQKVRITRHVANVIYRELNRSAEI